MESIPRISFNDLKDNNALAISNLSDALNEHGFFSIYDHPVNKDLIKKCYDKSKDFFALSEDKKCAYAFPNIAGARGYTPFGKETALGEDVPDLKEFWHHGPVIDTSYDSRISENIIINEIEKFNSIFDDLFNALNSLGIDLLSCIAPIIGLDKNYFDSWVNNGNSLLRMIHYPPSNNSNIYRAREHCDINLITLLIGAEEKGLEIKDKNNTWIEVEADQDDIVCNIGDMMQLITDGKLKSTPHRVIKYLTDIPKSRYSIPFFLHPSPGTLLKSIYDHKDKGVLAHDFLDERLKAIKLY
ncbi:MAG: isopenicillin N synthase family oxygenase [Woeseiaceae bacterium]|jgi:isopenicillin N synthase-like dioxygenase|nr:isopenicillin N synthase family oxygenase [Woeseiaceae bacterium]